MLPSMRDSNMRYAARTDENQSEIISALRKIGAEVYTLHTLGKGVPDLLVGFRGINLLFEVKNPKQSTSNQQLTSHQKKFHTLWPGKVDIVRTPEEAIEILFNRVNTHYNIQFKG